MRPGTATAQPGGLILSVVPPPVPAWQSCRLIVYVCECRVPFVGPMMRLCPRGWWRWHPPPPSKVRHGGSGNSWLRRSTSSAGSCYWSKRAQCPWSFRAGQPARILPLCPFSDGFRVIIRRGGARSRPSRPSHAFHLDATMLPLTPPPTDRV